MLNFQLAQLASYKNDLLSGLTVALALVPEAVAFAFVAGVEPLVGLYAAFLVGLITACIGGRPGMISGATGALAVVMVALVADHGVEYLFITVVLMGILQITAGLLKLGKFIRMVPYPVMLGFVNGLAIVIFLAQLSHFGQEGEAGWLEGTFMQGSIVDIAWLRSDELLLLVGLVGVTMLIIRYFPRITTAIPASLVSILIVTGLVFWLNLDTKVVGDVASIKGGLPNFHIPTVPYDLDTLFIILPYALILAAIGLIESLLTMRLIDEITESRGRGNRECIGQGVANTVTGFFGGMGGCAMIGQSMINVNSGGKGRLSSISAALFLLLFILVGSALIERIPLAALIGVMFIVVIATFEWSSFRIISKVPQSDAFILILVSAVTVMTDLAVAVIVGVIVSALVFAWEHAKHIRIEAREDHKGSTVYAVMGPLFFGSVTSFLESFDPRKDNNDVIVDFARSRVADHSGLEAIDTLAERYLNAGKTLHLVHLSSECRQLLTKAGSLVEVNVIEDPKYFVAEDSLA
jgi:SulP family sulfate permease